MLKRMICIGAIAGLVLALAGGAARAATINVHWDKTANNYSGQGILPDVGNDTWNYFQNKGNQSSLLYSDGTAATGVGFTTTGGIRGSDHKGNSNQLNGGFIHTDGRYSGQIGTITFTGLDADTAYKLAVMGVRGDKDGGDTYFTAGGVTKTAGTTPGVRDDFLPANWAIFDSITSDGAGNLAFTWTAGPNPSYNNGYLNAVQVQDIDAAPGPGPGVIPEPATLGLLSLAACGLGGYVRRRRVSV